MSVALTWNASARDLACLVERYVVALVDATRVVVAINSHGSCISIGESSKAGQLQAQPDVHLS